MLEATKQSNLINKLYGDLELGETNALERFWKTVEEVKTPLIERIDGDKENMLVTVLWRGSSEVESVSVIGEFFGFNPNETRLGKIVNSDVWYKSFICPMDARSLYLFTINASEEQEWGEIDLRIDPLNPKKYVCPKDDENLENCSLLRETESLLEMPKAKEKKYINEPDNNTKGKVELFRFESTVLGNVRRVWVYTPVNYNVTKKYGMTIFMDGWEYINIIKAPTILDNLISDNLIAPVCAVFIESTKERDTELTCNKAFTDFLAKEIVPWMHKNYSVINNPEYTIAAGFSYGALAACYAALIHPDKFGKVLGQSGGFSWKPEGEDDCFIIREFEKSAKLPVDFYLDIGSFELRWPFVSDAMKRMTDVLYSKGYNLKFNTFTGGHVLTDWQDTLADGLIYLENS
jgi:enterochelin esterase family protein